MSEEPEPTPAPPTIHQLIPRIIGELPAIGKDSEGDNLNYRFRGIDDIMPHVADLFAKHGVFVVPRHKIRTDSEVLVGRHNSKMTRVVTDSTFRFYGPAGDYIEAETIGEARDSGDKAFNKAETIAYKYALVQVLAINDGDDPDRVNPAHDAGEERLRLIPADQLHAGMVIPDDATIPEGTPWALNNNRQLVYAETPNFEAMKALAPDLERHDIKDEIVAWATAEGITLTRGHDEPGVGRVVERARQRLAEVTDQAVADATAANAPADVVDGAIAEAVAAEAALEFDTHEAGN